MDTVLVLVRGSSYYILISNIQVPGPKWKYKTPPVANTQNIIRGEKEGPSMVGT